MKHGHGNDGPATPASVAHRGAAPFDHRHGWEGRHDGHHHQSPDHHHHYDSPASAPDPQDGLVAVIGGSAIAVGDASAVSGFVENVAIDKGASRSQWARRSFRRRRSRPARTAPRPPPTPFSMCRAPISSSSGRSGIEARRPRRVGLSELDYFAMDIHGLSPPHGPIVIEVGGPSGHHQSFGHDTLAGRVRAGVAMAEAHGANTLSATLTSALTVENHFSFVNATAMVAL